VTRGIVAREQAAEILRHEMTVGHDHEAVVRKPSRQIT